MSKAIWKRSGESWILQIDGRDKAQLWPGHGKNSQRERDVIERILTTGIEIEGERK